MAYSKFTWKLLRDKFGIKSQERQLFNNVSIVTPSDFLLQLLKRNSHVQLLSEKARSEAIVQPILVELVEQNYQSFTLYSGVELPADKKNGLSGECDFLLGSEPKVIGLSPPIFTSVEAKKADIDLGLEQCAAQMLGARIYNQKNNANIETIYGCVTTGRDWQFMLLEGNMVYVDTDTYFINNIPLLLGVLQTIVDFYQKPGRLTIDN